MPDSEMFKIIMQGGMFGLWFIFIWWLLFYGAPMVKDSLKKLGEDHAAASASQASAMEKQSTNHESLVLQLARECREERKELLVIMGAEREKDRDARHEQAQRCQARP